MMIYGRQLESRIFTHLVSWNMHLICMQLVQGLRHFLLLYQSAPNMVPGFYLKAVIIENTWAFSCSDCHSDWLWLKTIIIAKTEIFRELINCVSLGWSLSGSMIHDHGASKQPVNLLCRDSSVPWCSIIQESYPLSTLYSQRATYRFYSV